jgi:hypothetical protein
LAEQSPELARESVLGAVVAVVGALVAGVAAPTIAGAIAGGAANFQGSGVGRGTLEPPSLHLSRNPGRGLILRYPPPYPILALLNELRSPVPSRDMQRSLAA